MSCVTVNLGQDALVKEIFNLNVIFPGKIKVINKYSGLYRDTVTTPSTRSLKMATFNCHLNLNNFQIVCHKATCYGFSNSNMKQDIISYTSTVEDTRTKSTFITHFGRHNN